MKIRDIQNVERQLQKRIYNAIADSAIFVANAAAKHGKVAQEPDFVASLCLRFGPELYKILQAYFPRNKFAVTTVFCHQKPLADIGEPKAPEIGDLLLVYAYTDGRGHKKFNSILLQAKITSRPVSRISRADAHQLKLYTEWPDFKYIRGGSLTGIKRSVNPKTACDGAQYLLIDDHPVLGLSGLPSTFPMGCASAAPVLTLNNDLASEIIQFLKFKSGRPFEEDPALTKDEWTKMIWDLIEITKNIRSKRVNAGHKDFGDFDRQNINQPTGYHFFISMVRNSVFSDLHQSVSGSGNFNEKAKPDNDQNSGIPIILIESEDGEGQEREEE